LKFLLQGDVLTEVQIAIAIYSHALPGLVAVSILFGTSGQTDGCKENIKKQKRLGKYTWHYRIHI